MFTLQSEITYGIQVVAGKFSNRDDQQNIILYIVSN